LLDVKQKLQSERDNLLKQVVQLRKEITEASTQQQLADQKIQKLELELAQQKVAFARVYALIIYSINQFWNDQPLAGQHDVETRRNRQGNQKEAAT
jgi:hypothetical protein